MKGNGLYLRILALMVIVIAKLGFASSVSKHVSAQDDMAEKIQKNFFSVVILAPVIEELLFRGIPMLLSNDIWSLWFIVAHILFAVAHFPNFKAGYPIVFLRYLVTAIVYAWIAVNWGLAWAILGHALNNGIAFYAISKQRT